MCAVCVAQGVGYVGASLAGLRVMSARARSRRLSSGHDTHAVDDAPPNEQLPGDTEPV